MRWLLVSLLLAATTPAAADPIPAFYPEAPVWIDGALFWAEMDSDRVMTMTPEGPRSAVDLPGCGPTSLAPYAEGLVVLCHRDGSLRVLPTSTEPGWRIAGGDGPAPPLRNPNDSFADPAGGVWFTDPGRFWAEAPAEGRLYRLDPEGHLTLHADGLFYGNGVFVDAPRARLLVSEHLGRRVLAYPLTVDGVGSPETLVDLDRLGLAPPTYPEAGPDGLEIGPDGTLWIVEYGAGRILGWREGEGLSVVVPIPARFVTNIAFGPDGAVAITGSFENTRAKNRGAVWLTTIDRLQAGRID